MSHSYFRLFINGPLSRLNGSLTLSIIFLLFSGNAQAQQGLKAEYYDGINFNRLVAVKYVANIDQYWNTQPPVPGINPHHCSIRWSGKLKPGKSGTYQFSARVDDGIRVWVDNRLIINQWELNDVGIFQGTVDLVAHREYDLKVEYFNALIEGEVRLLWTIPKAEKSWYERWFGEENYTVIAPEYFFRPDEFNQSKDDFTVSTNNDVEKAPAKKKTHISKPRKTSAIKKKESNNSKEPVALKAIVSAKEAKKYIPKNIAFKRAETIILESSYKELNLFAQFMLDNTHLNVMIEGHTDPVGDAESNLQLSKRRAYTVARYIIDKGVDRKRIKAEGFGGSKPLVTPEEGKYYPANRRVVFIVSGLK